MYVYRALVARAATADDGQEKKIDYYDFIVRFGLESKTDGKWIYVVDRKVVDAKPYKKQVLSLLCFTSTKVHLLTLGRGAACQAQLWRKHMPSTQFTCFTSAKVRILTPEARSCVPGVSDPLLY